MYTLATDKRHEKNYLSLVLKIRKRRRKTIKVIAKFYALKAKVTKKKIAMPFELT